jgi:hypothetical protein
VELNPYAGGFFPGKWAGTNHVDKQGIYGVRSGFFITNNFQLEGNFSYLDSLKFREVAERSAKAFIFDFNGAYNFPAASFKRAEPFVAFGAGALMAESREVLPALIRDGDTFFALNYGGGIKANRLWGPMGLRGDFRGRTMPNVKGSGLTWFEATGGVNFIWGER